MRKKLKNAQGLEPKLLSHTDINKNSFILELGPLMLYRILLSYTKYHSLTKILMRD